MTLGQLVAIAYGESMPRGDLTSLHLNSGGEPTGARLVAREDLVLAGRDVFEAAVRFLEPHAQFGWQFAEGELVLAGQSLCWLKGQPGALLGTERVALDLMGRACGIATLTRCYVGETNGTRAAVVNARHTTPGLRDFEFSAVRVGGGRNPEGHYSDILYVTVNQARAAGSLARALQLVRAEYTGPVTVECASLEDVTAAVRAKVARLVLVGMGESDVLAARQKVPAMIPLEAGGALTLNEARRLAQSGIDFVRVDQLTSAAPRAELALAITP